MAYLAKGSVISAIYIAKSTDQGVSWPTNISVKQVSATPNGVNVEKPMITVDNTTGPMNGRIYVCWQENDGELGQQVQFAYSDDHGLSYNEVPIPDVGSSAPDSIDPLIPAVPTEGIGQCRLWAQMGKYI